MADDNSKAILDEYRTAGRVRRDMLWIMYIGLRRDMDAIEDEAADRCQECGKNPCDVYCSHYVRES